MQGYKRCYGKTIPIFTRRFDPADGRPLPSKNENISGGVWKGVCSNINTCTLLAPNFILQPWLTEYMTTRRHDLHALDKVKKNKHERNHIIDDVGQELVQCICDCVHNVLNGNIPINGTTERRNDMKDIKIV